MKQRMPTAKPQRSRGRGRRGAGRAGERSAEEFDQVILDLARVTRVMAGGKRMRFRACVAIGDKKGRVGLGIAKGADVQLAISKATNDAKKNLVPVITTESGTIPHEVRIRDHSAKLLLKPAPAGTGVIAGSVVRQILELAGVRDVVAKMMGTSNKVNNAKTLLSALGKLRKPKKPRSPASTANQPAQPREGSEKSEKGA